MGKKIDRFVLTSVLSVGLFLYFEAAFRNRFVAVILSLLCCMTVLKTLSLLRRQINRTNWQQKRLLRKRSGGYLMEMACMEADEALPIVQELVSDAYDSDAPVSLELLHPSFQLTQSCIFKKWREFRGADRLIICTTGKCSSESRIFASTMKAPKLAIIDGDILSQLIAAHPEIIPSVQSESRQRLLKLNHLAQLIFNRRNAPRGLLFSFSMLVMYVFSGNISYLCASLFLLFTALVSFRRINRPEKLF